MELHEVREFLQLKRHELQGTEQLGERLLIRNGHYSGVRFDFESCSAIWRVGQNEITIISDAGTIVKKLSLESAEVLNKRAA